MTIRYEFEVMDECDQTVASGAAPTLEQAESEGRRYLAQYQQDGPCTLELRRVEVLKVSSSELPTTPDRPPLWRVMHDAHAAEAGMIEYSGAKEPVLGEPDRFTRAAKIRAVRDWLLPEQPEPQPGDRYEQRHIIWRHDQRLRAWLSSQADRAERGDG